MTSLYDDAGAGVRSKFEMKGQHWYLHWRIHCLCVYVSRRALTVEEA